jgi:hypothetical protein
MGVCLWTVGRIVRAARANAPKSGARCTGFWRGISILSISELAQHADVTSSPKLFYKQRQCITNTKAIRYKTPEKRTSIQLCTLSNPYSFSLTHKLDST